MKLRRHIYHMAEAANWPSIQRSGLLPACELLRLSGLAGTEREGLERTQRLEHTTLPGGVQLRDQRPMAPTALASCLIGLSPSAWYALINARVFFWLSPPAIGGKAVAGRWSWPT